MATLGLAPDALAFMRQFIAARFWKFAKTYAKTAPHEYHVRHFRPGDADFERFVGIIREHGYDRQFWGRTYRTFDLDGQQYWTMGAPVAETMIINRAPVGAAASVEREKGGVTS